MITVQRFSELGEMKAGWLHARYHFSFANYHNPARMGFGTLRVINDERVKAGQGFQPHPHRDMEIITYVREGAIRHRDSLGNEGVTRAGDVQVMSAGTGITHSEFSDPEGDTTLYQIWIEPDTKGVPPRWDSAEFPKDFVSKTLPVLVSGREADLKTSALYIHADAAIYGGRLQKGASVRQPVSGKAYVLMSRGEATVNGQALAPGDGAEVSGEQVLDIVAASDCEVLVIEVR